MKRSSRITINTAASYSQSLFGVGLALFSSRWILQALGATDFGLFQVVGSLIVFLTFFNSVMANSAARHFAFAIGKGDTDDVNCWFNTSLSIHLILPIVLITIGWPIAEYAIRNWLTIPSERIDASVIVFRISLGGAFVNMASIPFIAMFQAKQRIAEIAMWDLLQNFMVFALAWSLTRVPFDQLLAYAAGMVGIHILIHVIKCVRALILFPECRLRIQTGFDIHRLIELIHFAGWSFFGNAGETMKNQGGGVLLNLYFGPSLNAAFGIAKQVAAQTNKLCAAMLTAFTPEVTALEGRGDRASVLYFAHFISKIGCILVMVFAIPLILEMDYVLHLWLTEPPAYTAIFCQLILVTALIERLTNGYMVAVSAKGIIAGYKATIGGILLLSIPLAWILFALGFTPSGLVASFIATTTLAGLARVGWMKKLFNEPINKWLSQVLKPCFMVSAIAAATGYASRLLLPASFTRLLLTTSLCIASIMLASWFLALNNREKTFLLDSGNSISKKLKRKGRAKKRQRAEE